MKYMFVLLMVPFCWAAVFPKDIVLTTHDDKCDKCTKMAEQITANPTKLCQQLRMCRNGEIEKGDTMLNEENNEYPDDNDSVECEACMYVLGFVKDILADKSTEKEIQELIQEYICSLFGPKTKDECDKIVAEYLPALVEVLASLLNNTKEVCSFLDLCKGDTYILFRGQPLLPVLKDKMVKLAVSHADDVIRYLEPYLRHKNADWIGLGQIYRVGQLYLKSNEYPLSNDWCKDCMDTVDKFRSIIEDKKLQKEIRTHFIVPLCALLGQRMMDQCIREMNEYMDMVIEELKVLFNNSRALCVEMGFCRRQQDPFQYMLIHGRPLHHHLSLQLHLSNQSERMEKLYRMGLLYLRKYMNQDRVMIMNNINNGKIDRINMKKVTINIKGQPLHHNFDNK